MAVHVLHDPAAGWHLARLRDAATPPPAFRQHARSVGALLTMAALSDVPAADETVRTPLANATVAVPRVPVVAVPVLRAGLGLLPGVHDVLPDIPVGMVGLERDPDTLQPREYYRKLPAIEGAWVLVLEPMLATGGSAGAAAAALQAVGADLVLVLSVVATNQAFDRVEAVAPGTRVVAAAIDPELDDNGYIVPGLGDFGDRLFGTSH